MPGLQENFQHAYDARGGKFPGDFLKFHLLQRSDMAPCCVKAGSADYIRGYALLAGDVRSIL